LSEAAAEPLRRYLGFEPRILPGGVDLDSFAPVAGRAEAPTLVCTANLGDPRKGADVILEAFTQVRQALPAAELRLVSGSDPVMAREALPVLPEGARWVVARDAAALAAEYSAAWASLLPSTDEAFGLVVLESLACGTPVIVARSGALPEIVTDDELGWIVEPGSVEALAAAMSAALSRPPAEERSTSMRARAAEFDWEAVTDLYEGAYAQALADPA
jgi:glycosyltransferase involved in cell wall biosynthesis